MQAEFSFNRSPKTTAIFHSSHLNAEPSVFSSLTISIPRISILHSFSAKFSFSILHHFHPQEFSSLPPDAHESRHSITLRILRMHIPKLRPSVIDTSNSQHFRYHYCLFKSPTFLSEKTQFDTIRSRANPSIHQICNRTLNTKFTNFNY